ncbi:hypothetical protein [Sorangium cellulosum]|uniref:Uncharacterized protein n=1 Tax=Sorangium cellulosum So0157-2 TaxID=1254432 RepID=S4XYZ8_SORCE|nr:hypothetical protein [Sorangium cellulosum]AGP37145.1 hypothetical protein SCE1572_23265 [Sorangium cellulosum So0157-2]
MQSSTPPPAPPPPPAASPPSPPEPREVPQSAFAVERKVLWVRALVLARRFPEARALLDEARLDPAIDRRLLDELDDSMPDP